MIDGNVSMFSLIWITHGLRHLRHSLSVFYCRKIGYNPLRQWVGWLAYSLMVVLPLWVESERRLRHWNHTVLYSELLLDVLCSNVEHTVCTHLIKARWWLNSNIQLKPLLTTNNYRERRWHSLLDRKCEKHAAFHSIASAQLSSPIVTSD